MDAEIDADLPLLNGFLAERELLVAEGGSLTLKQFASEVRMTTDKVDQMRINRQILAVSITSRNGVDVYVYPGWQIGLIGLEQVLSILDEFGDWFVLSYLLQLNSWLGGASPLVALRQGRLDAVLNAARAMSE